MSGFFESLRNLIQIFVFLFVICWCSRNKHSLNLVIWNAYKLFRSNEPSQYTFFSFISHCFLFSYVCVWWNGIVKQNNQTAWWITVNERKLKEKDSWCEVFGGTILVRRYKNCIWDVENRSGKRLKVTQRDENKESERVHGQNYFLRDCEVNTSRVKKIGYWHLTIEDNVSSVLITIISFTESVENIKAHYL